MPQNLLDVMFWSGTYDALQPGLPAASKQKVQERFDSAGRAVHPTAQRLESQAFSVFHLFTLTDSHADTFMQPLKRGCLCTALSRAYII